MCGRTIEEIIKKVLRGKICFTEYSNNIIRHNGKMSDALFIPELTDVAEALEELGIVFEITQNMDIRVTGSRR